jgi:hypothetical protein
MRRSTSTFLVAAAVALAALAPLRADDPRVPEYIYGAELMTSAEREQYRREVAGAREGEEREHVRERHRERMQQRARARGLTLDEKGVVARQPPAR